MNYTKNDVTAIILAGGEGKRFGGLNKGLLKLNDDYFISIILATITKQTNAQIISVNNNLSQYKIFNRVLVKDTIKDFQGPLSGITSCQSQINTELVFTIPCDVPLISDDLIQRLLKTYNSTTSKLCVAHDGNRLQNLIMLFNRELVDDMQAYFSGGQRSIYSWLSQHDPQKVDFSDCARNFTNINSKEDLNSLNSMKLDKQ